MSSAKKLKPRLEGFAAEVGRADVELLRSEVARLSRDLRREQAKTDLLLRAAREILQPLRIDGAVKPYKPWKQAGKLDEVQVAVVSDTQVGKVTETYNFDVFRSRMRLYFDRLVHLANLQRSHHPVHDLVVLCNGDLVEGEGIFPGQAWESQAGALEQSTRFAQVISAELARVSCQYRDINVYVTGGNHGRTGREWNPKSNFDLVAGELLTHLSSGLKNVTVEVSYNWYRVVDVAGFGIMVTHGDKIRSGGDTPFTAIVKRVARWRESIPEKWHALIVGHFHNYGNLLWNGAEIFINGSPESSNDYALSYMGMASDPLQLCIFIHPTRGITARYPIRLSEEKNARP